MSGRGRMWGLSTKRPSSDGGRVRYSTYRPAAAAHDDLEDIAVVSNADPGQVKYGSGPITANGPRVIPGIIRTQRSVSGGRLNSGSPILLDKPGRTHGSLKRKSVSRQSLLDMVSSKFSIGSRKRFSRDSFSSSYINRAQVASELDVSRKTREIRKREIKNFKSNFKVDVSSTGSSDRRQGCRWSFVFDPAGRLCYYWSMVVSLAFLYNLWVIVYRFAFHEITTDTILVWFCLDYLADLIYVLDILFHFRTGYLEDGVLQTDSRKLRQHYMNSTTFYVDCLCLLPLDFLYLSINFKSILRCFRLVKIYKYWHFLDRTERHTNSPNLFRSASLIHYLLVIFHWNACIFYIIDKNNGFSFKPQFLITNNTGNGNSNPDGVLEYLRVFYWCTLSLTTIGGSHLAHHNSAVPTNATGTSTAGGNSSHAPPAAHHPPSVALNTRTKADYLYQIAQLMFGLLLFATVLGHIANIVTNVSAARKEFQAKLDGVKTYMRLRRVPAHLQAKVIKWFDYLWLTQKCSDEERAVSCLPDKLKAEIAIHVHLDTLKRVEIFQNTEAGFLCELVLHLRPVLFSPGDYICRKGEVGKEMYIVNRGRLQVVADDGKTMLATLKAGSYFGEISILNMGTAGNRRTASVRSVGYSDLFVLSKKDMWDVLKEYPAARVRLEAIAAKRLEKYKKAPLEKAALGRSSSTPGLVESTGRVPLEEMWLPPLLKPPRGSTPAFTPLASPRPQTHRSQTLESERLTMESALSDTSSRHSPDDPTPIHHHHHPLHPLSTATTTSATSYDSVDKRTSPHPVVTPQPLSTTPLLPPTSAYTLPVPQTHDPPTHSPASDLAVSTGPIVIPGGLAGSHSAGALPRDSASPQDMLLSEIRRLRERLQSLEAENASMTLRLSQQQWQVENRLHEIELHLCPNSSTASSGDDSERNRESII